jgi:hypothetical protein
MLGLDLFYNWELTGGVRALTNLKVKLSRDFKKILPETTDYHGSE